MAIVRTPLRLSAIGVVVVPSRQLRWSIWLLLVALVVVRNNTTLAVVAAVLEVSEQT
jgi:hypothetical protein